MKEDIFKDIYETESGFNAGSSHAITGYKVRDDVFITLWHEDYVLNRICVHRKEEDMMQEAEFEAELDSETGDVSSSIPGVFSLNDFLALAYMSRYGEVVRDDS